MQEQQGVFDASRQSREDLGGAAELASGAYAQVGHSVCLEAKAPALRHCNGLFKSTCIKFVNTQLPCVVRKLSPCSIRSCLEVPVAGSLRLGELFTTV